MPLQDLKIALIPLNIVPFDPKANLDNLFKRLATIEPDTDIVVVPEMFSTGFTPDKSLLARIAEPSDGPTMTALRHWASENHTAIWGTFIATDDSRFFNRGFMIDDEGQPTFYDKHHLFSYGGENEVLTAGSQLPPIVSYRTWNLRMAICYDLRFPVWNRARRNDYDVLIVPANWPTKRFYPWKHLLIARAIENQTFVVGCNREGSDFYGEYNCGESLVFNNWGKDVADRRDDGTIYATLNAAQFSTDRHRFAPWRDADNFTIDL